MSLPKGKSRKKSLPKPKANLAASRGVSSVANLFRTHLLLQVLLAFLLVLALKWPVLHDPPVWDTAMSVFPAAITLVEYDFDLLRLLRQPGYMSLGPNVHAESLVTLITAVFMKLTDHTGTLLPSVHLFHFLLTALVLVAVYRYAKPLLGEGISLLCVLSLMLFPIFFTQAGYMHLEMPLLFTTLMALLAWRNGKLYQAMIWAILAVWVKQTGIIVAAALFLGVLAGPWQIKTKLYRISVLTLLPLLLAVVELRVWRAQAGEITKASQGVDFGVYGCILVDLSRWLPRIPDLAVFLAVFSLVSGLCYKQIWRGLTESSNGSLNSMRDQTLGLSVLIVACFLAFFYLAFPLVGGACSLLPRYYVVVLPFVFTTLTFALLTAVGRTLTVITLLVAIVFFLINREGVLYPSDVDTDGPGNNFALVERSYGYRQLASIQGEAMAFLAERVPARIPIFFGLHEGYLNRYPLMGYVNTRMENAKSVASFDMDELERLLKQPPGCAYFLYNYPWLGGHQLRILMARLRVTHNVEDIRTFQRGKYKIHLFRARRIGTTCPGNTSRAN